MSLPGSSGLSGRRPDRAALVIGACLVVAGAVVGYDAWSIRTGVASYSRVGPAVFPYAIAAGLVFLGLGTIVSGFRHAAPTREDLAAKPVLWIVGGLLAQIALLPFAGFSLATGAVFAATAYAFGKRRLWFTYPIGVAFTLVVWLLFAMVLRLVLPAGPLERAAQQAINALIAMFRGGGG